jgi:hypothetical protein
MDRPLKRIVGAERWAGSQPVDRKAGRKVWTDPLKRIPDRHARCLAGEKAMDRPIETHRYV